MDRRTRKILATNGCLHTKSNVARLYLPRKEGGRGLIGIEESVRKERKSLYGYLTESTEWMLQAALKEKVVVEEENLQDYERRIKEEKVKSWKEKALHVEFVQQTSDVAGEESWRWLRNGFLKKETEGLILAAQEQALRTNSIKHSVDKTSQTPLCRLCGESTETVWHIVSGCKKLAQNEYRKRHDKVALRVHWEMCRKYRIDCTNKWYDHQPLSQIGQLNCCYGSKEAYMTIYYDFQLMMEDIVINGVSQNHSFIRQKSFKLYCHEDFAVLGHFYAKIITLRL